MERHPGCSSPHFALPGLDEEVSAMHLMCLVSFVGDVLNGFSIY